ncbi:MAG: hypothetical protein AB1782_10255 [Cyanobacteriota bacterium]
MHISFNGQNNISANQKLVTSKNNNVFAQFSSPTFTAGRYDLLVKTGKATLKKTSALTKIKDLFIRIVKKLPFLAKNTADDVARTGTFKNLLSKSAKLIRNVAAYCAAAVTVAVVAVRNFGDDIKIRLRANVKPVSLTKDVMIKVKDRVALMNSANYAAIQRSHGPGVTDILDKAEAGISQAVGVNIEGSVKKMALSRIQSLFSRN